jgi:hypothetical protein
VIEDDHNKFGPRFGMEITLDRETGWMSLAKGVMSSGDEALSILVVLNEPV